MNNHLWTILSPSIILGSKWIITKCTVNFSRRYRGITLLMMEYMLNRSLMPNGSNNMKKHFGNFILSRWTILHFDWSIVHGECSEKTSRTFPNVLNVPLKSISKVARWKLNSENLGDKFNPWLQPGSQSHLTSLCTLEKIFELIFQHQH